MKKSNHGSGAFVQAECVLEAVRLKQLGYSCRSQTRWDLTPGLARSMPRAACLSETPLAVAGSTHAQAISCPLPSLHSILRRPIHSYSLALARSRSGSSTALAIARDHPRSPTRPPQNEASHGRSVAPCTCLRVFVPLAPNVHFAFVPSHRFVHVQVPRSRLSHTSRPRPSCR